MLSRLRSITDALFRRDRFEHTLSDEMRFHMDAYAADLVKSGVPGPEALRRARLEFGPVESLKEDARQARGLRLLDETRQDLRYAGRQILRSPGFTAAIVLSLALGIGANTAIFSLMDAVLFRALPIKNPNELYYLAHGRKGNTSSNYPLLERYRAANIFSGVTAYEFQTFRVRTPAGVERENGSYVSGNFHAVVGVPFVIGRGFSSESDRDRGANPIAVISERYWTRKFARSADVIGRTLSVDGRTVTIVGVTAAEFTGLAPGWHLDITLPMSIKGLGEPTFFDARDGWTSLSLVGRLKPGVSEAQTLAAVNTVFQQFWMEPENAWARKIVQARVEGFFAHRDTAQSAGDIPPGALVPAGLGSDELRGRYTKPLRVLMGLVGVVLLIACVNAAMLLLARASVRAKEVAVRMSIGAGRARIIRQLFSESLMLALGGGMLGVLVAVVSSNAIVALFNTGEYPVLIDTSLSTRVLFFTVAASLVTGIGFGLAPAFRATRVDLTPALKSAAATIQRATRLPAGRTLVTAQIALCVLVIATAGLLVQSLRNLRTFDAGFARERVLLFNVETTAPAFTEASRTAFLSQLLDRLRAQPRVVSAAYATRTPLDFSSELRPVAVPGYPAPADVGASAHVVTAAYFQTLGIGLVRGRVFTDQDRAGSPNVVIIDEKFARDYFGEADPLGHVLVLGAEKQAMTIVGVVRNVRHEQLRNDAPRTVYSPLSQPAVGIDGRALSPDRLTTMIRTSGDPRALAASVREQVRQLDPNALVYYTRTMRQQLDAALVRERFLATLSTGFGLLATVLAAVGLFGLMAYRIARRTGEIGIRMALGATRARVLRQTLNESLVLSVAGVVIGLGATLAATQVVSAFLFGLSRHDPRTLVTVALILLATTCLAGYIPARRAARVEPMRALRAD